MTNLVSKMSLPMMIGLQSKGKGGHHWLEATAITHLRTNVKTEFKNSTNEVFKWNDILSTSI